MKKLILILVAVAMFVSCNLADKRLAPADYVNPFVGTDFHGHTFPGAILPFGMIQVSPDTRLDGWDGCSGYHYSDSVVYGFSHTHLSGTGVSDYGDVLLMPFTGNASPINSDYASVFSHKNETASPGYYSVFLDKYGVTVELTASRRVGLQRYTFPDKGIEKGIILDLKHRDFVIESSIFYDKNQNAITGIRNSKAWNQNQHLAYSILFSEPVERIEYYINDTIATKVNEISGKNCKAVIYFAPSVKKIILKTSISANTEETNAAMKNQAEVPDFDFDRVKNTAKDIWNSELGKITVETKDIEKKKVFYTALYHSFTAPYLFTDIDGRYLGQDGKIHQTDEGREVYTVFSLWDTYRALHPLLNIIDQKRSQDFVYSFMKHYEEGGMLTVWELAGFETWCMIGYHSVPVIFDAYKKGFISGDLDKLLNAMIYSAKLNRLGRPEYAKYGYIPGDMEHESISKTLEYAYDDWCIAQFAQAIGNDEVYFEFNERCQYWKNILDENGFMHPKINGGFAEPFNPTEINNHFTEGNSWQYSTYIPHDFSTYIDLIGGNAKAEAFLDSLFHTSDQTSGREQVDVTGLVGQYAHGNEPSHHTAYLYNFVGKPYKTQEIVRHIMKNLYSSKADGLCGNEDCGQMSAWYVFTAIGFYPVCPGDNRYVIGSPIFDKVSINLENGKTFTVVCKNQSDKNLYIKSAKLNGENYTKSYITYDDIKNGGTLEFEMSSKKNKEQSASPSPAWAGGWKTNDIPISRISDRLITINPVIMPLEASFRDKIDITLKASQPDDVIFYTLDGSIPNDKSPKYTTPITISGDTKLRFVAFNSVTGYSKVLESDFFKFVKDKSISIKSHYNRMYSAGGDDALIDNIRGKAHFALGGWQGYQGQDFEATIDLETVRPIKELGAGFLQNTGSWILFPKSLSFEISDDGKNFKHYGSYKNTYPVDDYTEIIKDFSVKKPAKARYIKVIAEYPGILPEWHLGYGGESFIFIDEIWVK